MLPRNTKHTLFPYTTLFRSRSVSNSQYLMSRTVAAGYTCRGEGQETCAAANFALSAANRSRPVPSCVSARSEEHTSELQSRVDIVCRLLLEKKKEKAKNICK